LPKAPPVPSAKPRRRRCGFEPASRLVAGHLRGPLEKRGFAEAKLITHWAEVVGADLAEVALPVRVRYSHGSLGATLVLLTTGSQAPILEMQKDTIRQKVNACYGYNAISRVQITQTAPEGFAEGQVAFRAKAATRVPPSPETLGAARAAAAPVHDPDLKAALERLAVNVITKHNP